ncbi:hypothetical protein [Labrys miyagiensis]|uniref:hypothetical protein n=1 Tax=Labrys miyagiensis TaxID=346912 RepID=UPI0024E0BA57|nr:hypothetical protein [Labrys miyagiensis]
MRDQTWPDDADEAPQTGLLSVESQALCQMRERRKKNAAVLFIASNSVLYKKSVYAGS